MVEVTLIVYSPAESREFQMVGRQLSLGRGDDVTLKLKDDGLSRLHATVYRDEDRVSILDEVSTNGTCVNGARVPPAGSPLSDGDEISIGNDTVITVSIRKEVARAPSAGAKTTPAAAGGSSFNIWPIVAALVVVFLILIAALAIGSRHTRDEGLKERVANSRQGNDRLPSELPASDSGSSNTEPTPTALPADSIIASHDNTAVDDD